MGIRKRSGKRGIVFQTDYFDSFGNRRYKSFKTLTEARDFEAEIRTRKNRGETVSPSRITFANFDPQNIILRRGLKPSTLRGYMNILKVHLLPRFGSMHLKNITRSCVKDFESELRSRGLSRQSRKHILHILNLILDEAVEEDKLQANPCRGIKIREVNFQPPSEEYSKNFTPLDEANARLYAATALQLYPPPMPHGTALVTALYTGLRRGEILGLMWKDVNLDGKYPEIRVRRQRDWEAGLIFPKSKAAIREVPLLPIVCRVLKEWRLACPDRGNEALIFQGTNGPLQIDAPYGAHRRVLKAVGLPHFKLHGLRISFGSIVGNRGTNPKKLQRWMGHERYETTMNIYVKFVKEEGEALPEELRGLGD